MTAPVRAIAELARCLAAGETPEREVCDLLAPALQSWLRGDAPTLDVALGLVTAPGKRTARTEAILAERDELLRDARRRFFADLPTAAAADELHKAMARYSASGWRFERTAAEVPPRRAGTLEATLWRVLKLRDDVLSARRLRAILATS